jgi:L-fuconolactonase
LTHLKTENQADHLTRRTFIGAAAGVLVLAAGARGARAESMPIIDTHIHLFDPRRLQGVPWPPKDDAILYQPALPDRYREVTKGLGIVGAIEIECSNWLEDNQWVLDVASTDTIVVGTVGNLEPGKPGFRKHLERFHKNPLFRGIRYGNLWGRNLSDEITKPQFLSDLQALAEADLGLDTAMPDPVLIAALVRLTDAVPNLRVVIDHMLHLEPPVEASVRGQLQVNLQELAKRPHVYVKASEVARWDRGETSDDLNLYRPRLDALWDIFGPDKLIYGSDWPNSDHWAAYPKVLNLVREYISSKGPAVAEKFFWKNSIAAYRWVKRASNQP